MKINKKGWRMYPPNTTSYKFCNCFWQKCLYEKDDDSIYSEIAEYELNGELVYEATIRIPDELSITGITIHIETFTYTELDFNLIEKHAKKIIDKLIK